MIFQFKLDVNNTDYLEFFADGVNSAIVVLAYNEEGELLVNFVLDGISICRVQESNQLSRADIKIIYNCAKEAIALYRNVEYKHGYIGYGSQGFIKEARNENQILN